MSNTLIAWFDKIESCLGLRMKAEPLGKAESLLLDIIRISAAAMVAAGHLTQPFFSDNWPDLTFLAQGSVAVFFVLSGFVIRYVTCRRPSTFEKYSKDRASRIYSVVLPALLVTLIADSISRHVNPVFYVSNWGTFSRPLGGMFENLVFSAQVWKRDISPLSNSPFWSLNYEVAYYVLYGCWFYLTGRKRWFWIAAITLIEGPSVIYLFPLWIAGCIAHDLYQKWNASGTTALHLNRAILGILGVLTVAFIATQVSHRLGQAAAHLITSKSFQRGRLRPGQYSFGLVGTIFFMRLLLAARQIHIATDTRLVRFVRFVSEGTFPLYLLHFPLLVLIAACIPYNHASAFQKILIFLTVLTVGVLAGHPCNVLKVKLRNLKLNGFRHRAA